MSEDEQRWDPAEVRLRVARDLRAELAAVWRRVIEHHPDGTTVIGPRQIETMFTHQHKDDQ